MRQGEEGGVSAGGLVGAAVVSSSVVCGVGLRAAEGSPSADDGRGGWGSVEADGVGSLVLGWWAGFLKVGQDVQKSFCWVTLRAVKKAADVLG